MLKENGRHCGRQRKRNKRGVDLREDMQPSLKVGDLAHLAKPFASLAEGVFKLKNFNLPIRSLAFGPFMRMMLQLVLRVTKK
jgi:hypothetical protein